MAHIRLIVFLLFASASCARGQTASTLPSQVTVTFYSSGSSWRSGWPGKLGPFLGRLFDGEHQLAFIDRGRFVTFSLLPGVHVFAADWWTSHHPGGAHLTVELEPDEHYFIRLAVQSGSFGSVAQHIQQVTCEGAQQDNTATKPLDRKHIKPDGLSSFVNAASFPLCE